MSDPSDQKPRRLEDTTAAYLADIEIQYNELCKKLNSEETAENKSILVNNVFQEIHTRTASAACDRRTNYILEQLCFEADFSMTVSLLESWIVYAVFLARNRYGSHVVQAIISRLIYLLRNQQLEEADLKKAYAAIIGFTTPVLQEISWLGKEMSASHVIRSSISLVLGLPLVAEKKGKMSKHKHSIGYSEPMESLLVPGHFFISEKKAYSMPPAVQIVMISALDKLLQKSSVELQQCIAETSSCAILTFLLRILSNPKLLPKGAGLSYLSKLLEKVMFVSPAITADTEYVRSGESRVQDLFYAMAGDKMGSYFLETLFEACPVHVFDNLMTEYAFHLSPEAVLDYAKDAHGNFLLQAVLKRLVTQSSHYSNLLQVAHTIACSLLGVAKGDFADLCRSRIMVVYWLSELIRTMHADDMMLALFDKVFEVWTDVKNEEIVGSGVEVAAQYLSSQLVQKEKKVEGKSDDDLKPMDSFSVNLAKIIGSFLQSSETTVRGKIRCTVCLLSTDALRHVGTTGALSKAIFDVFLDSSSEAESKQLGQKLVSIAYDLAAHYAGQHVLRRVYQSSDLRGREKWVSTLLTRKEDLVKSKEGRNALHAMSADLFERDTNSWRAEVKKLMKEQQKEQEAKKRERELEVGEKGGDDEGGEGRRKRKRKRGGKKKTDGSGGEVDNDNEEED